MAKEIDFKKVKTNILKVKKPDFSQIDELEWRDALTGIFNSTVQSGIYNEMDTEQFWTHVYFGAFYFLKGMEYARVKAGLIAESLYPRY